MNPLSIGERYNNAVIYSFVHHVNHDDVVVYGNQGVSIQDAPYREIATFLSRRENEVEMLGRRVCLPNHGDIMSISPDKLEYILSKGTHGLSVFIGVFSNAIKKNRCIPVDVSNMNIKGVCILTPRIMLSFGVTKTEPPRSVSIYVCEHLAWAKYITLERESLELVETTEYIQKFREIAGEQTLYRYNEIPWFVIPFTSVDTCTFMSTGFASDSLYSLDAGTKVIRVSSTNFALFYSFVNECSRDFRCCILNEITQLQSLVEGGIYQIYMLLLNNIRVIAVYIFESSWIKVKPITQSSAKSRTQSKKTRGNRISALHDYISRTSTAVVKYLPPAITPKYDAMGRRTMSTNSESRGSSSSSSSSSNSHITNELSNNDIILLKSSILDKTICSNDLFVRGCMASLDNMSQSNASNMNIYVSIDTLAHNHIIVDIIGRNYLSSWKMMTTRKWYYILYNAIIHQEVMCKDVCII